MPDSNNSLSYREISLLRDKHRALEMKEHRLKLAIAGFLAYSAITHILAAALNYSESPIDSWLAVIWAALFVLGFYRVWIKDDSNWWPVLVPSGTVIIFSLLLMLSGVFVILPILLHSFALLLVFLRKRAIAAVANSSFKRTAVPKNE
jgi:hypothetical protein